MSDTAPAAEFPAESTGLWARYRNTPWSDLLRGRTWGRGDHRSIIAAAELPAAVKMLVNDVVTRTRLWPRERQAVARELCDHFIDGLEAGRSSEELIAQFGDSSTAARLISRAKIRCRPWSWRVWQIALGLALLIIGVWVVLVLRHVSATPTITYDPIAEYDDRSRDIPENERAWPYYRQGIISINRKELYRLRVDGREIETRTVLDEGPPHPDWPHVRAYLSRMEAAVRLFVEGTNRAELGFINRDPGNDAWRRWESGKGWELYNSPGTMGPETSLSHAQDLRIVFTFIQGAMYAAIEDEDGPHAVEMVLGMLRLADHGRQTHDGYMADLVALYYFRKTLRQVQILLLNHPDLVSDISLERLNERIAATLGEERISYRMDGELRMWEDYLQRIYSDDGQGNGRITPEGLSEIPIYWAEGASRRFLEFVRTDEQASFAEELTSALTGSVVAPLIADRRSMERKVNELHELWGQVVTDVDTDPLDSKYFRELERMVKEEPIRYLPYTVMKGRNSGEQAHRTNPARLIRAVNVERDAALVMIALERHRRRNGSWPGSLEELVPDLLPSVPVDLFSESGQHPLIYRVVDGKPRIYSVGPDHSDNGGEPSPDELPGWNAGTGDWQLIPPQGPLY